MTEEVDLVATVAKALGEAGVLEEEQLEQALSVLPRGAYASVLDPLLELDARATGAQTGAQEPDPA